MHNRGRPEGRGGPSGSLTIKGCLKLEKRKEKTGIPTVKNYILSTGGGLKKKKKKKKNEIRIERWAHCATVVLSAAGC